MSDWWGNNVKCKIGRRRDETSAMVGKQYKLLCVLCVLCELCGENIFGFIPLIRTFSISHFRLPSPAFSQFYIFNFQFSITNNYMYSLRRFSSISVVKSSALRKLANLSSRSFTVSRFFIFSSRSSMISPLCIIIVRLPSSNACCIL